MPGIIKDHSYTIVPGEGHHGSDSEGAGGLEIDLPRETCSPRDSSGSGASSPEELTSRTTASTTDSDSPPCSPPDNDNIPDTQKYKNRMLVCVRAKVRSHMCVRQLRCERGAKPLGIVRAKVRA